MITVPQGWEVKKLGELVDIIGGGTPSRDVKEYWEKGTIPWVTVKDLHHKLDISDSEEKITELGLESSAANLIPPKNIITPTRMSIGRFFINSVPITINQDLKALKPKKTIFPLFLLWNLLQYGTKLETLGTGTTVKGITLPDLKNLKLPVPSLLEQKKIAEILSSIDRAIEATQALIGKQKMIKKALMADLLNHGIDEQGHIRTPQTHRYIESPLGIIPEGWEVKCLGEVGECINGLTYSQEDVVDYDGILVLRSSNIQGNKLAFDDNVYVRSDMRIKDRVQANDILICVRNGSKALIGKNALISEEAQGQAHGAFMTIFRTKNYKYIFQLFQSDMYTAQVEKNLGATINSINNSDLLIFQFPMPINLAEQQKIAQILSAQDHKIETEVANLAKLQHLKKALMADLLSGKVRV